MAVAAGLAPLAVGYRDRRLDRLARRRLRRRRHQADARPGQPDRHRADLGDAGYGGPDDQDGRRRGGAAAARWPAGSGRRGHRGRRPASATTTPRSSTRRRWTARASGCGGTGSDAGGRGDRRGARGVGGTAARRAAQVIDPVELADVDKMGEPEFAALMHEFKHDINAYLAGLGGDHPADLAGLIDFIPGTRPTCSPISARSCSSRPRRPAATSARPGYLRRGRRPPGSPRDGLDAALDGVQPRRGDRADRASRPGSPITCSATTTVGLRRDRRPFPGIRRSRCRPAWSAAAGGHLLHRAGLERAAADRSGPRVRAGRRLSGPGRPARSIAWRPWTRGAP